METLQRTANRGSISTGGYEIDNSCKFEDANSESLHKSLSSQSRDCFTISFWHKRTSLGASRLCVAGPDGNNEVIIHFTSSNELEIYSWEGAYAMRYKTNRVFRDTSAFYHFAFLIDTRLSTASERTQIYVNGVLETSFSVSVVPGQNSLLDWTTNIQVGRGGPSADADMSGYLSEFVYLDDTKAAHTDLGEFDSDTGIWIPIDVSGLTFGTNGAYLDFKDSSNLGNDANGGTDFTATNITAADQATDTPTNNFCTFNPLQTVTGKWVVSNGATSVIQGADYGYLTHAGNMGFKKGKWYAEFKAGTGTVQAGVGMNQLDNTGAWENSYIGAYSNSTAIGMCKSQDGYFYRNGGSGALGVTWTAGDILGIAIVINADGTGFLGMSKNGTWENSQDPSSGTSGMLGLYYGNPLPDDLFHSFAIFTRRNNGAMLANFGGYPGFTISSGNSDANGYGNFEYAVPTGYYALCTKNLAEFG